MMQTKYYPHYIREIISYAFKLEVKTFDIYRLAEIGSRLSLNDTQRETISKTLSTVKDELTDLSAKVDNISLDVKDGQAEANVQRKMLESQIAQWVGSDIAFILNSGMTKTYNFRQLTLLQKSTVRRGKQLKVDYSSLFYPLS